jgi:uncharacterized protein (DUF2235 family)
LGEAYIYLMRNYTPGDRIYIFGFSRGAYTARALAGLLTAVGLFRPGSENLVTYAVTSYTKKKKGEDDWGQLHEFARDFAHVVDGRSSIPVEFLGLWDTVKAAGVLRWDAKWPWTRNLRNVRVARHAVSIDEKRRPYKEYLVGVAPKAKPKADVEEVWFAGVHSDVGGTFEDDPKLCRITLKWMVEGAIAAGVLFKPSAYAEVSKVVETGNAVGTVHRMGAVWALLTYRRRTVPHGAKVHASVQQRIAQEPKYQNKIPDDVVWADPLWTSAVGGG